MIAIIITVRFLNTDSNLSRSAGTWVFAQRRWLDPSNDDDFARLKEVKNKSSLFFWKTTITCIAILKRHLAAGLPSATGEFLKAVELQRGALHPGRRRSQGLASLRQPSAAISNRVA
jgi:hypothetical protein